MITIELKNGGGGGGKSQRKRHERQKNVFMLGTSNYWALAIDLTINIVTNNK